MVAEYECYHFIEFEYGIYASYKKSSERIILVEILNDNLYAIAFDGMILIEHFQEIVQIQICLVFMRFPEFFIYFLDDVVGYHSWIE